VLATGLTAGAVAWSADLPSAVGMLLYTEQFLAAMLGLSLALVFVHLPASRGARTKLPWYDALLATIGFAACAYVAVRFPDLVDRVSYRTADILVLGTIMLVLCLEGLRRTVGMGLVILVLACFGWALIGPHVPGPLTARPIDLDRLVAYLAFDTNALFGPSLAVAVAMVIVFVLFGQLLLAAGGGAFFSDAAITLAGRYRGGSAKVAVIASSLFGTVNGTVVANILVDGPVTIPMMHRSGYPRHVAAAIEAVASTGGQIMPPVMGVVAFLMAEYLQVAYREVVIAAIFPALLYYLSLFLQVDLEAARRGIRRVPESEIRPLGTVLREGWFFTVPFAILLGGLFWLNWQPEKAAFFGALAVAVLGVALGYRGTRLGWRGIAEQMSATGLAALDIVMICASAGFIIGIIAISGLGFSLTLVMVKLGEGNVPLLLAITAALSILLGMGMPSIAIYILQVVMFVPALVESGISAMAAHMFIFYFGMMSFLTPPLAIGAFAAATVAQADPMKTAWTGMRIGWVAYVIPFLFVASPSLLLQGDPVRLAIDVPTAIAGVFLVSVGAAGYLSRALYAWRRIGFIVAGVALMVPAGATFGSHWTALFGLALGTLLVWSELCQARRTVSETTR
jgi:TRAP transporter 4TM/12TM fusion protein